VLANLGHDGEHVWLENLATIIGRRRRKVCGTGDDAVETGSLANMLARVLLVARNGGDITNFELGQALASVCACPAEKRKPLFVQTLTLIGLPRGTPQNEAKASLVRKRDKFGSRWFRGRSAALGRKQSAGVCRRCPIEQRTTNDCCGWGLESAYCKNDDDEIYLPELRTGSLDMERVTRIFSVRMREVMFTEGIAEEIRKCKSAKQKVIQGGCLGLKE
jgi:hypothetical protein